jgi:hypothetical protein
MAKLKHRETRTAIKAIAESMGAIVIFENHRPHPRAIITTRKGNSRFIVYAGSSRSSSGLRNCLALVKRTIQNM